MLWAEKNNDSRIKRELHKQFTPTQISNCLISLVRKVRPTWKTGYNKSHKAFPKKELLMRRASHQSGMSASNS
jgi:hypothetical protein